MRWIGFWRCIFQRFFEDKQYKLDNPMLLLLSNEVMIQTITINKMGLGYQ
jgi:hypothetical protein